VLVIGVITVFSRVSFSFSPSDRFNGWNRFECQVFVPSPTLIDVAGQIIIGFISFGTLHTHTTEFEPWQWYDKVQLLTDTLTFL
jgi:hypothetical protein